MSRINDALKQVQQSQSGQPPAGVPPLTPAARTATGGVNWGLPILIGLLLLGAGIFIGMALFQHFTTLPAASAPVNLAAIAVTSPKAVEPTVAVAVATPVKVVPATNQPTVAPVVAVPVAAVVPAPLKLQGIMADPGRPSAIINGQTVLVGDQVGDFRVKAISPTTVTLEKADGSMKTLSLVP